MTAPISGGYPTLPSSLTSDQVSERLPRQNLGTARNAPTTPGNRMPVIDRNKVDPQIRAAGEGMEAMFIDYMMKVMRESVPKNEMDLDSPAADIYRGMLDSENSKRAAKAGGIGIADQIIAYLESQKYTKVTTSKAASSSSPQESGPGTPAANSIGGTHENHQLR